jgi:hypothetical protein
MYCLLNVLCVINCIYVFYYRSVMLDIHPIITCSHPETDLVLIHIERVSVFFNNTVRFNQRTCNTTQYIFNCTNFSYGQYKGIFCSVIIVVSCFVSRHKLAMTSLSTTRCIWSHTSLPWPSHRPRYLLS